VRGQRFQEEEDRASRTAAWSRDQARSRPRPRSRRLARSCGAESLRLAPSRSSRITSSLSVGQRAGWWWPGDVMLDDPTLERVTSHPEERSSIDNGAGRVERFDAELPLDDGKVKGLDDQGHVVEPTNFCAIARSRSACFRTEGVTALLLGPARTNRGGGPVEDADESEEGCVCCASTSPRRRPTV